MSERYSDNHVECPHCGHIHIDSWEWKDEDDQAECEKCGKKFAYQRDIHTTYTSWIKTED